MIMKIFKISIIMIILFMSAGAVCAADAALDGGMSDGNREILETAQDDALALNESKTFTDLADDISSSADVFDVADNYKFNNATDNNSGIVINKENFVINGNGYTIDANGQSALFTISARNVTINNLTLINAYRYSYSVFAVKNNCSLTTNNVNFINNTAVYGVMGIGGTYTSNNDRFTDSVAATYGVINVAGGVLNVNDAVMTSSKMLDWGFIYSETPGSVINVSNSTFANTTSNYTAAVRGITKTVIRNSKFINLYSKISAGAIAVKSISEAEIDNCTFVNVTSSKNGGAILADVYDKNSLNPVTITNSNFIDCYSEFGGAILQLGGILTVDNCNFTDNSAMFDGAGIYLSWVQANISNSRFTKNHAIYTKADRGTFGGAIYFDNSTLRLWENEFINNSAQCGGALYIYDSSYYIVNNTFSGNTKLNGSFDDVFTVFDNSSAVNVLKDNTYSGEGACDLDNVNYATVIDAAGMKLVILNNTIDIDSLPIRFDLRDWGWTTPVEDQGRSGSCWTFGSAGAMESAILRYLGIEINLSENNMRDVSLQYSPYGGIGMSEGGSAIAGAIYALSWFGVFPSQYDFYDEMGKISPIILTNNSIHFQDVIFVPVRNNATDNDLIKKAILKYGALSVSYHDEQVPPYYNPETGAQYCNESHPYDHCVTLIGWDDSYSASNFLIAPPGDGAWIIKNSWGTQYGVDGYFYISYWDVNFAYDSDYCPIAYSLENTVEYNKNYQYDIGGGLDFNSNGTEYVNSYVAIADDLIAAVGTYFNDTGVKYSVEVYVEGDLKVSQSGVSPFAGFNTIKLNSYVPIKKGEEFSVLIKSNAVPIFSDSRQHYINGSSKAKFDGAWQDVTANNTVCSIKAYTVFDDSVIINNRDISVDYAGGSYFSVKVVTSNGHAVGAGAIVKFTINGKTTTAKTDKNGIAKIKISDVPKKYPITTTYNGKTYKNYVTVKQVLTTSKVTVKKTAKSFTLKAKLKINGKLVKGKIIKFKLNGKTYTAKTNSKGIAQKTLGKNVIKKLKKGKTYAVQVTYIKDTIKTTLKVK